MSTKIYVEEKPAKTATAVFSLRYFGSVDFCNSSFSVYVMVY